MAVVVVIFSLLFLLLFNAALLYKVWSLEAHTTIQLLSKQQHYHSHTGPYHKRIIRQVVIQSITTAVISVHHCFGLWSLQLLLLLQLYKRTTWIVVFIVHFAQCIATALCCILSLPNRKRFGLWGLASANELNCVDVREKSRIGTRQQTSFMAFIPGNQGELIRVSLQQNAEFILGNRL